ncbi:MAG TPA: hypothetical protein VIL86_04870 [Tepidisphaeraceae bacterium]|jgi:hypothetical protein
MSHIFITGGTASEETVHVDQDHQWHMRTLARLAEATGDAASPIIATRHKGSVNLQAIGN